jgi:AbrB family looped-hinge helix DNA binding protein
LVLLASITAMRVTTKGQVTIPLEVRRALGIRPGTDVRFELEGDRARLVVNGDQAAAEIARLRGAGDVEMTTDEILALTRR